MSDEFHMEIVARRRATQAFVRGYAFERAMLKNLGWNNAEIERIIKREREITNRGRTQT